MKLKLPFTLPKVGLLARVVAALSAVGFIPLFVVPYIINLNADAFDDQVLRAHAMAARTTAQRIDAFLSSIKASGVALALNPDVYGRIESPLSRELIANYLQAQPSVVGVQVTNPQRAEFYRVQRKEAAETVDRILANPSGEQPLPLTIDDRAWIRMEITLSEGRGLLRLVIDGSALQDVTQNYELGKEAAVIVANKERNVVFSSEKGLGLASFPSGLVEVGLSGHGEGAQRTQGPDGLVLGAAHPIPDVGWFVLTRQPAVVAERIQRRMRRNAFVAAGVALSLTALLSTLAYNSVVRPIRDLVASQRRLAGLGRSSAKGNEIEQLKASFAILERQTQDREAIGDVFLGRYQVLGVVGTGGMGTVFRGWDPKLQRAVALKTVRFDDVSEGSRGDRVVSLLNEAVTVAKFSDPNIVAVYDVEDVPEAAFIAMEFVDGMSLDDYLSGVRYLPASQVVPLGAAIARGLASAHDHGVVHRDVKPGNVLLGREGGIKVTDFGISGLKSSKRKAAELVFGTPGYLAPETIRGEGQDELGDIFALGVVLYQALTGSVPFSGKDAQDILMSTVTDRPAPPSRRQSSVSLDVDSMVAELIEKDRRRRTPSAREAANRLERIASAHGWRWSASVLPLKPVEEQRGTMATAEIPEARAKSQGLGPRT